MVNCPYMSSIKYHEASHRMLITSSEVDNAAGVLLFSPPLSEEGSGQPRWLLGEGMHIFPFFSPLRPYIYNFEHIGIYN